MGVESKEYIVPLPEGAELLVERVLAGRAISRSPRLRSLLAFLCEWTLTHHGEPLSEEQIGIAVFGRQSGYDTSADTHCPGTDFPTPQKA